MAMSSEGGAENLPPHVAWEELSGVFGMAFYPVRCAMGFYKNGGQGPPISVAKLVANGGIQPQPQGIETDETGCILVVIVAALKGGEIL